MLRLTWMFELNFMPIVNFMVATEEKSGYPQSQWHLSQMPVQFIKLFLRCVSLDQTQGLHCLSLTVPCC